MPEMTGLTHDQLNQLRAAFEGEIVTSVDDGYDEGRRLWNAMYDLMPAALLRPTSSTQVAAAIRSAREHDFEIAVRSGGHSPSGHSSTEGGVVLDLSRMRGVTVDPAARTARANGGALLGELDVAAQAHGLVCPVGVVGHTGVAGLTLGGGVGRLQRRFGLTIDSLRAVELVTADGRHVRASETEEPELFWGMRGAGWNFGVVTAFEFALHPFGPHLHRGVRTYPASAARTVWEMFRAYSAEAPDTMAMIYSIASGAHDTDEAAARTRGASAEPVVVVSFNHSGRAEDVVRDTAALSEGPEPLSVTAVTQPYLEAQTANDLVLGWGRRTFIAGLYANDIRPEAIDVLVGHAASAPPGASFSVTAQGGAIARVSDDAMAFTGRSARFDLSADATWDDAADDDRNSDWVRQAMSFVQADAIEGRYANENADAGAAETRAVYGESKVGRLVGLKRVWDPDNVFRRNHNVAPADDS
jgi:FAD/FMN-containing dehydrogenase